MVRRASVLLLVVAALFAAARCGGDDDATSSTTRPVRTSTTALGSTTTTAAPDTSTAVFPVGASAYTDPAAAARAFAEQYIGFTMPIVGAFAAGDARSGEVPVRTSDPGPVTTVLVRQLDAAGHWWVLGATTPNLVLAEPTVGGRVASPVTLRGTSTAFEAQIRTEIRQDSTATPLGEGTAMGGANGEMGPFVDVLSFTAPSQAYGAVMLSTRSAKDGTIAEATVVRVAFAR
ncbi:MAG: Gmad2 immunoglobulin-like domain-containing protein [Actinomycetes bacterium]